MNIFVLDRDPIAAARQQCDKHVVKMVLETAQLLSVAHRLGPHADDPLVEGLYKVTHQNHPCALWARETNANYVWLEIHLHGLLEEYTRRYKKVHKVEREILPLLVRLPNPAPTGLLTPFPQAMPDEYRDEDAVVAYRRYYVAEKAAIASWRTGSIPGWFQRGVAV